MKLGIFDLKMQLTNIGYWETSMILVLSIYCLSRKKTSIPKCICCIVYVIYHNQWMVYVLEKVYNRCIKTWMVRNTALSTSSMCSPLFCRIKFHKSPFITSVLFPSCLCMWLGLTCQGVQTNIFATKMTNGILRCPLRPFIVVSFLDYSSQAAWDYMASGLEV